jgi:hypothetical protein
MKTQLFINDTIIQLSEFSQTYIGNILRAITASLGYTITECSIKIDRDGCTLHTDDQDLAIDDEFYNEIVKGTVRGMLSSLNGICWYENVTITTGE